MLAVAGQTSEPNGLAFFLREPIGTRGVKYMLKNSKFKKSSTDNAGHFS